MPDGPFCLPGEPDRSSAENALIAAFCGSSLPFASIRPERSISAPLAPPSLRIKYMIFHRLFCEREISILPSRDWRHTRPFFFPRMRTLKNHIPVENDYLPGDLEVQIGNFVEHSNRCRYHERLTNLIPADVSFGCGQTILLRRRMRMGQEPVGHIEGRTERRDAPAAGNF